MGPGRLTGMNAVIRPVSCCYCGSFNGARSIDRDERPWLHPFGRYAAPRASMGPGRLTGMNVGGIVSLSWPGWLQWGPVD